MRVVQITGTLSFGDAVSNNCIALKAFFERNGFVSELYAESVDSRLPSGTATKLSKLSKLKNEDILIYHFSIGCSLNMKVRKYGGRLILQYHNVTPASFFEKYSNEMYNSCLNGAEQLKLLKDLPELCLADSEFNRQDLIAAGYTCPIEVCPILIPFEDYRKKPNKNVISKYSGDGYENFLFVGRIAPNKRHEDIIKTFAWYKKHINSKCRLFFVGSAGVPKYLARLRRYIEILDVDDVIFPGHIRFDEILAYYSIADVFVCMSEHEGFCVPLIEAMLFDVPIVAKNTTAVPYTLGQGGFLVDDADPVIASKVIERIMKDEGLRERIIESQHEQLKQYSTEYVENVISGIMKRYF